MPKIQFKEDTLNGRAAIVAYADREYLTLRILRGNKKYSYISLQTADLKTAHERAPDVYVATINQPLRSRSGKHRFAKVCEEYLEWKQERCQIGEIRESAVKTYTQRIHQRVIPYAEMVGVKNIFDIKKIVLRATVSSTGRCRRRENGVLQLKVCRFQPSTQISAH